MKRLYFRNENMAKVAEELGFELNKETKEVEITINEAEYTAWENYNGISHPAADGTDEVDLLEYLEAFADDIEE